MRHPGGNSTVKPGLSWPEAGEAELSSFVNVFSDCECIVAHHQLDFYIHLLYVKATIIL